MTDYSNDFTRWLAEQAAALRGGKFAELDVRNIAEELDTLGRAEARIVRDRVAKLLTRLVMWQFQPANRWARQKLRIDRQRRKIFDLLDDSPSLRARLPEFISNEWAFACYMAGLKTGVGEERLGMPPECPWRVDQVLGADFYPGAPTRA